MTDAFYRFISHTLAFDSGHEFLLIVVLVLDYCLYVIYLMLANFVK